MIEECTQSQDVTCTCINTQTLHTGKKIKREVPSCESGSEVPTPRIVIISHSQPCCHLSELPPAPTLPHSRLPAQSCSRVSSHQGSQLMCDLPLQSLVLRSADHRTWRKLSLCPHATQSAARPRSTWRKSGVRSRPRVRALVSTAQLQKWWARPVLRRA